MPSPFHGIESSSRALRVFQRAMDTTGHNIANVNTRGYSRQTTDFASGQPITFMEGRTVSLGSGVNLANINRIHDQFLQARSQNAQGDLGRFETTQGGLRRVESVFLDAQGKGVSAAMDRFFNAFSGLSSNPSDPGYKALVQQAGADLAGNVRGTYQSLDDLGKQNTLLIREALVAINDLTKRIDGLNREIRQNLAGGGSPNDLIDARDSALAELGKMVNIRTEQSDVGMVDVYVGQFTLVDESGAKDIATTYDSNTNALVNGNGSFPITTGSLRGLFDTGNAINTYKTRLDTLANTLRTEVNGLHMTGTNSLGSTNIRFFNDVATPPQTGAMDFHLDAGVAGDPNLISVGVSGSPGDSSIALGISRLREKSIVGLGNNTLGGYYKTLVTDVGRAVKSNAASLDAQTSIVQQVEKQISDVSGVSIDDELANMLKFQRSYQAAAKAFSVFDETLRDLIALIR